MDNVTVQRLADAVRARDIQSVRVLLDARPELVHMDMAASDEHRALHYAVLDRAPEIVRLLMARGANARKGIYPHRDATSALSIAIDRGYDEIVSIIEGEEQRRREAAGDRPADSSASASESADGVLTTAVKHDEPEVLSQLLDSGLDPNERTPVEGVEPPVYSAGMPLWHAAASGKLEIAELLLRRGADPNAQVYASGSPVFSAYRKHDEAMIALLQRYGGVADAITIAIHGRTEIARQMLAGEVDGRLQDGMFAGTTVAEQILWGAADGGYPDIVRLALEQVDWPRDDARWYRMLWRPLPARQTARPDFPRYLECLRLMLERGDANASGSFGRTLLHDLAARGLADEQVAFSTLLLDGGARLDVRDALLKSTPLGWACRWGRVELVRLLLARGADPVEAGAEHWATPRAWAEKRGHADLLALLD
jgi:ankyrin repeat protein